MYALRIPRHACSPRDCARAGDLWRLIQEATVQHSAECGWPPSRYRAVGSGFVVRDMTAIHTREARYGEALTAWSHVVEVRRELLMRREAAIDGVMRASMEWVHIGPDGGPTRAPAALIAAFPTEIGGPALTFPAITAISPVELPPFVVTPWWTEMDPMGHVNHPRYVDWAEEAVSVWLAARGLDPMGLVPVAERVRFRAAAKAGDTIDVRGARVGHAGSAIVVQLRMRRGAETVCDVTLVRDHLSGSLHARASEWT